MNRSPCLDCKYRELTCHSHCESYLQYRKVMDEIKEKRKHNSDATGYTVNNIYKFKKARNLPQYR